MNITHGLTLDLSGKTALVIGGARGIGACVCRMLGQSGANVAWTHRGETAGKTGSAELGQLSCRTSLIMHISPDKGSLSSYCTYFICGMS